MHHAEILHYEYPMNMLKFYKQTIAYIIVKYVLLYLAIMMYGADNDSDVVDVNLETYGDLTHSIRNGGRRLRQSEDINNKVAT